MVENYFKLEFFFSSIQTKKVKKDDVLQMNPPKYDKCDDMADLNYLNDATILHNLRSRYVDWLIYVFTIAI